jgi:uncharacterized protein DUF3606
VPILSRPLVAPSRCRDAHICAASFWAGMDEGPMSDDVVKRGSRGRTRINMGNDCEVRYWTEALRCTKESLRQPSSISPAGDDASGAI